MRYPLIASLFYGTYWAVEERKFRAFEAFMADQFAGIKYDQDEIAQRIGRDPMAATEKRKSSIAGDIAVIPIVGVISHRAALVGEVSMPSAGVSVMETRNRFRQAMNNPNVGTIVLDVDSPGGAVDGVPELAAEIFAARNEKRIIAVANTMAASAAYWLASAATEMVVTPSGEVGSIGVYMVHRDLSAAYEADGIKHTVIKAGEHKAEGNPYEPLTEDTIQYWESQINEYYTSFINAIAQYRGVSAKDVKANWGQGRTLTASAAKKAGMVDRVATFDQVLERLGVDPRSTRRAEAEETARKVAEVIQPKPDCALEKAEFEKLFL